MRSFWQHTLGDAAWSWPKNDPKSSQNTDYLNKGFEILNLIHCQRHLICCFQMMDDFEKSLIHAIQDTQTFGGHYGDASRYRGM